MYAQEKEICCFARDLGGVVQPCVGGEEGVRVTAETAETIMLFIQRLKSFPNVMIFALISFFLIWKGIALEACKVFWGIITNDRRILKEK